MKNETEKKECKKNGNGQEVKQKKYKLKRKSKGFNVRKKLK